MKTEREKAAQKLVDIIEHLDTSSSLSLWHLKGRNKRKDARTLLYESLNENGYVIDNKKGKYIAVRKEIM
jgi:hypothetical protein